MRNTFKIIALILAAIIVIPGYGSLNVIANDDIPVSTVDGFLDIEVEKKGIFGANTDFYLFHHINAIDYDEQNNLLPTQHVRKLIKLFDENNI